MLHEQVGHQCYVDRRVSYVVSHNHPKKNYLLIEKTTDRATGDAKATSNQDRSRGSWFLSYVFTYVVYFFSPLELPDNQYEDNTREDEVCDEEEIDNESEEDGPQRRGIKSKNPIRTYR